MDICCAPGAKMCMIGDILKEESKKEEEEKIEESFFSVTGVDISDKRLGICKTMTKKYQIKNCRLLCEDGAKFCEGIPFFEKQIENEEKIENKKKKNHFSFNDAFSSAQNISKITKQKKPKKNFLFCNSFPLLFSSSLLLENNQEEENKKYDKIIVDVKKKEFFFINLFFFLFFYYFYFYKRLLAQGNFLKKNIIVFQLFFIGQ